MLVLGPGRPLVSGSFPPDLVFPRSQLPPLFIVPDSMLPFASLRLEPATEPYAPHYCTLMLRVQALGRRFGSYVRGGYEAFAVWG